MSLFSRVLTGGFSFVNRFVPWHRLPRWIAVANLGAFRMDLRTHNLHDTSGEPLGTGPVPPDIPEEKRNFRTIDGSYNDLRCPHMGAVQGRFGRNMPVERTWPESEPELLEPSPRRISNELMVRDEFIPAKILNVLAAAWIQFQTHDWFSHGTAEPGNEFELETGAGDSWFQCPMRIRRTLPDDKRTARDQGRPPTYRNAISHWWDASGIYGSDEPTARKLRTFEDGKLVTEQGRLPVDPDTGLMITGFNDNWWLGLALLHTLFSREHNAICEALRKEHGGWSDERIYQTARLINAALMAKIHTVEWTTAILLHPALQTGMRANWWGLAGKKVHDVFGRIGRGETLSGIPGSPAEQHGCPFALTEEFAAVYRLHPLIPDDYDFYSIKSGRHIKSMEFPELAFRNAQGVFDENVCVEDAFYSLGIAHPGAVTLHNYPRFLRDIVVGDQRLDLASVDVLRDRERGIPRYNEFRELLRMPRIRRFEDMTANPAWAAQLRDVYNGDVNRVDLMVGMYAETPPNGFGFSDTAFRIFILMASRRLKSDRFFTDDYRPEIYTQRGLDWINNTTMSDVLLRHYPELAPALRGVKNAFAPWNRVPAPAPAAARPMAAAR
jgi:hypothetical protein